MNKETENLNNAIKCKTFMSKRNFLVLKRRKQTSKGGMEEGGLLDGG